MSSIFEISFTPIIAGVATILLVCFQLFWRSRTAKRPPRAPLAAGGWPLLGHTRLLDGSKTKELPHITLASMAEKYGPIFSIRMGVHPVVVISSWELAKECFTTHDNVLASRAKYTATRILGYDYANFGFAPYGEFWREMRKLAVAELLSSRRIDLLKNVREAELKTSLGELYNTWTKRKGSLSDGTALVDIQQWFADLNMNVILMMVASKRCSGDEKARRYQKAFRDWFHLIGMFLMRDAVPFLKWLDFDGAAKIKEMERNVKELDEIFEEWLEEKQRQKSKSDVKKTEDFMDVMLSALKGVNHEPFDANTVNKATCTTLIGGATDTTAVTLTWALSLLLNNRETIKKAQQELDLHVGKGRLVNESDMSNLVYIQAIVKETLRLYPAGPVGINRQFTEDAIVGGYHVPAGTRLMVNLWKIQTDPRIWEDPFAFKPERFLGEHKNIDVKGQHFEVIPFGAGRRQCAGIHLGLQMTQLALAGLLQSFEISTPSNEPVDMTATFGLSHSKTLPLEVLVKPRLPPSLYM